MVPIMNHINLGDVRHTSVTEEIVQLAGKHTGLEVTYLPPNGDALKGYIIANTGEEPDGTLLGAFWEEFDRLQKLVREPLNEPLLPDDFPVNIGYWYLVDGIPRECLEPFRTVGRWKTVPGVEEIRRCDFYGRINRQPLAKEDESAIQVALNKAQSKPNKNSRKSRKTYKIKKMG